MVCMCSGCGGWSNSGFLCKKCREQDEKEALRQEIEELKEANKKLTDQNKNINLNDREI